MENANYQKDLLNQAGFEMLQLCSSQIEKATIALINYDVDLAEEVIFTESYVNALDIKIEKDCERFIALFNPVAIDLRFVISLLKINIELERIGDHAYGISNYIVEQEERIPSHLFKVLNFEKLINTVNSMFSNIQEAFLKEDLKSARKVFKLDKTLDKLNAKSFTVLNEEILKDPNISGQALIMLSTVKKYERVGDLLKNIAEEIIFYKKAEILKHKKKM